MLRNYVNEDMDGWDVCASTLTHEYNQVHKSAKTKPFKPVLSRPKTDFTLHPDVVYRLRAICETLKEFLKRKGIAIQRAFGKLEAREERCKRNFDKRVRRINRLLCAGDYVYSDPSCELKKALKLQLLA